MSLFPAYSSNLADDINDSASPSVAGNESTKCDPSKDSWLENPSFTIQISEIPLPTVEKLPTEKDNATIETALPQSQNSSVAVIKTKEVSHESPAKSAAKKRSIDDVYAEKASKRKKGQSSKSRKHEDCSKSSSSSSVPILPPVPGQNWHFHIDKKAERGYLTVDKLYRPATPLQGGPHYFVLGLIPYSYRYADWKKKKKKKRMNKKDRYFNNPAIFDPEDTSSATVGEATQEMTMEGNLSKKTAEFNKALGEDAHNVSMWLAYAAFQDSVCQFERTYRRGGGAQGQRVTAERKLAILDKALMHNAGSEPLIRQRCLLVSTCFPADEAAKQFQALLEKRPRSMALWQGLIGATQFSLSSCSVPKVMRLYETAMVKFHQIRRVAAAETKESEEKILDLLLRCGLFLRQAGLHEQVWMLMKHYIELNLDQPTIVIPTTITEKRIIEIEEPMLLSSLPLPEIWVRVETVRESSHWLPWDADGDCEDPQRVVFAEDVADMLHPITSHALGFRLAAIVLTAFKVPSLPFRDTAARWVGVIDIPWAMDSTEVLLTAIFPFGVCDSGVVGLLKESADLIVGPAYLSAKTKSVIIGKEEYLEFVTKVFHLCAEKLTESKRTALLVWWLRFERFLVVLSENDVCHALNKKKKVKSVIKDFLKQERNRNNLLFYREYALIEKEFGNVDAAAGILQTAISSQHQGEPVIGIGNEEERSWLCCLYRSLAELHLSATCRGKALNILVALGLGVALPADLTADNFTAEQETAAVEKFRHISWELVSDVVGDEEDEADGMEHLLPDFLVDWVACCAWLLYLKKSAWEAGAFMEETLAKFPAAENAMEGPVTKLRCRREAFFDCYASLMQHHCLASMGTYAVLREILLRALREFPNNTNLLAMAVRTESTESNPWWQLKRMLEDTDSQIARIFLVFLAKQRQAQMEVASIANLAYDWLGIPSASLAVTNAGFRNRSNALFRQLIADESTRQCPLVWRLFLYFLFEHGGVDTCRSIFYRAVEQCPWVKTLYLDGAKMLPADIGQVQDLIIEKELRLHVTPEELEILRSTTV